MAGSCSPYPGVRHLAVPVALLALLTAIGLGSGCTGRVIDSESAVPVAGFRHDTVTPEDTPAAWQRGATTQQARPSHDRLVNADALDEEGLQAAFDESLRIAREALPEAAPDRRTARGASAAASDATRLSSATHDLDVRVLLAALARENGLQLSLRGELAGRVDLPASERSLEQLLDSIAEQSDSWWRIEGDRLLVLAGERLHVNHLVDYLNLKRSTSSSVSLATEVGTFGSGDASPLVGNSSETRLSNEAEQHFWESLRVDIEALRELIDPEASWSINAVAGLVNVTGSAAMQREVSRYLDALHLRGRAQVLIEATVVEIALSDSHASGVDWQLLARGIDGLSATQEFLDLALPESAATPPAAVAGGMFSLVSHNERGSIRATLQLLEQFGAVRILSQPRIIALNNQPSVLKVVDNRVYFSVQVERRRVEDDEEMITSTAIHTVPVGLVMVVTPQIGAGGEVMLNVRPTLSRILGFVNDPNPALAAAQVSNGVPEIQVRELESMLRVPSGELAVIGGLMQLSARRHRRGVPLLDRLPIVGEVFSQRQREQQQSELLIVIRPLVLPPGSPRRRALHATVESEVRAACDPRQRSEADGSLGSCDDA